MRMVVEMRTLCAIKRKYMIVGNLSFDILIGKAGLFSMKGNKIIHFESGINAPITKNPGGFQRGN